MRKYFVLALCAGSLEAAIIHGTVVENQTGHPLARALVSLEPVAGTGAAKRAVRTNPYGVFEFPPLPAGTYLITASRAGFAPVQYGQKQWKSAGFPVVVADADTPMLTIRLPRFGAIAGTVLDENDVGLPEHEVVAYRNTRPPQLIARARSDDRGMYRLFGLEPGSYLVRSVARQDEEAAYLPTFARETQILEEAYPVEVDLDRQVEQADIRPRPGRLFTLNVEVVTVPLHPSQFLPVTMTLASDVGREIVQGANHRFGPLPPGEYDLFTEAPLDRRPGKQGDYRKIELGKDTSLTIVLYEAPELRFVFEGAPPPAAGSGSMQVLVRRKDLAGNGAPELLKLAGDRAQLAPGPWELAIPPTPGYYVSTFSAPRSARSGEGRADGWNEIAVGAGAGVVRFTLSSNPGGVHGAVKSGGDPAPGAPVFLEPLDLEPRRRLTDVLATRADIRGQYHFTGLAPGAYRVLGSFEYRAPDSQAMSSAGARAIEIEEGRDLQQDLELYAIR